MKAFASALIAVAALSIADYEYNDARYTQIIHQAMTSMFSR